MQTSILLLGQIAKMFLMIAMGYILVKSKLLKSEESRPLSVLVLYLGLPCAILNALQMERSAQMDQGLLLTFLVTVVLCLGLLAGNAVLRKALHLRPVEQASVIYSNSSNMILPIISSMLGEEWTIYSCVFMSVQIFLMWTHMKVLLSQEKKIDWKKILTNSNILAMAVGLLLYLCGLTLPDVLGGTVSAVANILGPLSMFVSGMIMASADIGKIMRTPRAWLIVLLRLVIMPLCMLPVLWAVVRFVQFPNLNTILMIVFLATTTPVASTVLQMQQVCSDDSETVEYAGMLNTMSILLCIITMPILIGIFEMVVG